MASFSGELQDFDKFLGKYIHFVRKHGLDPESCMGYFITSGVFDPVVQRTARTHPEIKLVRIKS